MNDISSDELTDEEEINKNFETEAQLIVETQQLSALVVEYTITRSFQALRSSRLHSS